MTRRSVGVRVFSYLIDVSMIAVDHVGGHELMEDSRHDLDANEASDEATHHHKAGGLIGPPIFFQVFFRFR